MGYIRHSAVVLTSSFPDRLAAAHAKATELGCSVSSITAEVTNGYRSFLVAPDGSKEGWPESLEGYRRRTALIEWLRTADSGAYIEWAELFYGDDNGECGVTRSSDLDGQGVPDTEETY